MLAAAYVLALLPARSLAAEPASGTTSLDHVHIYLMTMGSGGAVYERFGHNALVVRDGREPIAFNYGYFSFEEHNFILRFLQGRMDYWMAAADADREVESYIRAGRAVWEQELNLSPTQKARLLATLTSQVDERYRYDYYTANCSTKVRDALDDAVGGQIRKQLADRPAGITYRYDTRRLMAYNPPLYIALQFILGHEVDRPLSEWQACYLPVRLKDYLANVSITDESGHTHPLIQQTRLLNRGSEPEPARPPHWWWIDLLIGLGIGTSLALLARLSLRHWTFRAIFAAFSALWLFIVAFAGCFAVGAWLVTTHVASYYNENILQFSPIVVPLMVLVPMLALRKRRPGRWTLAFAIALLGSSILGLALKALPWFYQANWPLIALVLPAHAGLLLAVLQLRSMPQQLQHVEHHDRQADPAPEKPHNR